jgi:hypothetical protein
VLTTREVAAVAAAMAAGRVPARSAAGGARERVRMPRRAAPSARRKHGSAVPAALTAQDATAAAARLAACRISGPRPFRAAAAQSVARR